MGVAADSASEVQPNLVAGRDAELVVKHEYSITAKSSAEIHLS
jgi:hypothetical protein